MRSSRAIRSCSPCPSRLLASRARITIPSISPPGWRNGTAKARISARPVAPDALERSFPGPSVQYLGGDILRFPHVIIGEQAKGQDRAAGQPRHITGNAEKPDRVLVEVQQITEPVRDHDSNIRLPQDQVRRKVRVESSF